MRDDNQVSITVHVPYEYDHMFDVIAATLSKSLYDHLVLGRKYSSLHTVYALCCL